MARPALAFLDEGRTAALCQLSCQFHGAVKKTSGQGATALHCDTHLQSHYILRLKPITNVDC